ncbi:MAG: ABC transporter permease [Lachnospiraceae bacterium]|nr:ABC transporter permease [Lachnospiraceae bacterium]
MNKILSKRFPREIRANLFRYLALFTMIALCMYIVIALVDAAEVVIRGTEQNQESSNLEDGQVMLFTPLLDEQIEEIERAGVTIEAHISYDLNMKDGSVLRIFKNREKIDLIALDRYGVNNKNKSYGTEPRLAEAPGEVVIEKRYAEEHSLAVGDHIDIGEEQYLITGIGSVVDYDAPLKKLSDTAADSMSFGVAFVTSAEYDRIRSLNNVGTEELTYAFVLNDAMSCDDLKQMIKDFEFDYKRVEDPYYQEILDATYGKKDEIKDGIRELADGADELYGGAAELNTQTMALRDGMEELFKGTAGMYAGVSWLNAGMEGAYEGSVDLADGTGEFYNGVKELKDGVNDLKERSDELMDEIFSESPDNIMEFMRKEDNLRIGGAAGDIEINKTIGMVAGIIVIILFTYVLSVFVIHQIRNESSVIGTFYALGVKKKDLMAHYVTIPTALAFLGGITGTVIGLSGFGSSWQMSDSYEYYSLPWFERVVPPYLLVYAVIMPPLVSLIVNYLVINKSLSRTALSLIKNEQRVSKSKDIRLGDMPFMRKFRIRHMLRERRTALTIVAGMMIALLIFMLGMDCYVLCESVGRLSSEDTRYEYMYTYKYPTKDVVPGGEACLVRSLKKELYGYTLDVTVMGIDDDNPYIDVKPVKGKNRIVASDAVAARYGVKIGDKLVLSDNADDINYAFTVAEITPYSVGLTVFMEINSMRELFGEDADYYNAVMADHELDIDPGRLYSTTTKADIDRSSGLFLQLMRPMMIMLLSMSVVIFCIVMYLMTSVMIDRAGFGISLLKIFGFRSREVKRLYLDGNRIVVIVGALISIPVAKNLIDAVFPMFIANVACSMHLEYRWYHYVMLFAGILLSHTLISLSLTGKLGKISPAEVLKNRE